MQFDPSIHTKEFLLSNHDVAFDLAEKSVEFAKSNLANDFDILKLVNKNGLFVANKLAQYQSEWIHCDAAKSFEILNLADNYGQTVAHWLAIHQAHWIHSEAAKSLEILKLANNFGYTVAHNLASNQSEWIHSEAAKNLEILKLTYNNGTTVAHKLAQCQPEWIHSEAAKSFDILKLADNDGTAVAHHIAHYMAHYMAHSNENCINYEPLFQKQVLTLEHEGKLLAEEISERFKSKGFDVPVMAVKLISQGAAYKHSKPIAIKSGEAILEQCKTLIEDGLDPLVSLKHLQAIYSTFSHNVSKIISTQEQKSLQKWQSLLLQSENMIRQHLDKHPELLDVEHTVDIFCEPGDVLLKKLQSERILTSDLASLSGLNNTNSSEQEPKIQSLY